MSRAVLPPHAPPHRRSAQRGFTLLEVLLSFAILAVVTTIMTQIVSENMEKAASAIDKRELREIADTIFGKILFEQTDHRDGAEGSISVDYGQWAHLPQARADRYSMYRWRLKKTEVIAAGETDAKTDAEKMFGDDSTSEETSSTPANKADEPSKGSIRLIRFTLTVYHQEEPNTPLATLTRYLPPPEFEGSTK
jgi:prepilin-type N-terminal cleavage/methylation domain-containing protein